MVTKDSTELTRLARKQIAWGLEYKVTDYYVLPKDETEDERRIRLIWLGKVKP